MPPKAVPVVWGPNGVIPGHVRQDPDPREAVFQRVAAVAPIIPPPPPPAGGLVAPIAGFPEILLVKMSDICTYNSDAIVIATDVDMQRRNEPYYTKFHTLAGPNLRLWNDTVHYQPAAVGIGPPIRISEIQVPGSAVRSPAFGYPSCNWIIMANVPPFVDGPVVTEGWRGNGHLLYRAYIQAFIAAYENPDARIPQALLANLPPANVVNNAGGLTPANLPRSVAFSFMGPAEGYPLQMAANIAVCAIYDAFWHPPGNQASYWGGLSFTSVGWNRDRFRQISLCASSHKPGGHTSRAQVKALQAAYRWRFTGANRPFVPNFPGAAGAAAPPAPIGAAAAPPVPTKFTRSGRTYG